MRDTGKNKAEEEVSIEDTVLFFFIEPSGYFSLCVLKLFDCLLGWWLSYYFVSWCSSLPF